jgi:hypothetical protein
VDVTLVDRFADPALRARRVLKRKQWLKPGSLQKDAWRDAARAAVTPLVQALLEHGFRYADLVRIVGEAALGAVLEAGDLPDAELAKRTGVPRGVVRRLRAGAEARLCPAVSYAAATRLVSRWLSRAEFYRGGKPRILPLHGPGSFATLAAMSGVDPATALPALESAGVVRVAKGHVALCKDAYVPSDGEIEMLDILGRDGAEFLRTIIHNTQVPPARAMFQRKTSYDNIGSAAMKDLRVVLRKEAMRAILTADRTLAANDRDRNTSAPGGKRMRVSFGVYVAEEPVKTQRRSPSTSAGRREP